MVDAARSNSAGPSGTAAVPVVPPVITATTLCLVRHGETDWNLAGRLQGREDVPLNERGRAQAGRCAVAVAGSTWDVVLTSPLLRAAQTAEIIAAAVGIDPVGVPELVERDYGAASGLTRDEVRRRYPDGVVPGEESRSALAERGMAVVRSWVDRLPGRRILVVSHGGVISSVLELASAGGITVAPGTLANGSLSVVRHDAAGWAVPHHNVVDHLAAGHPPLGVPLTTVLS